MAERPSAYDYIIVGAGSAGCLLAGTLSANPETHVLLLEAGSHDRSLMIRLSFGFGRIWMQRRFDWGYSTEPDPTLDDRRLPQLRGKVIGGSSSINALNFVRGQPADYDRWAEQGATGWSWPEVEPWLRQIETWENPEDRGRGAQGGMFVRRSRYEDPLVAAWLRAGEASGMPVVEDFNLHQGPCQSRAQVTLKGGRRWSAADAWLKPALSRPNLTVITGALVTQVLIERGRACGVAYRKGGTLHKAVAGREVLLAGGAINSPQILMLSGIGDPDDLAAHGIPVQVASRGVGRNLQDHPSAAGVWRRRIPGPYHKALRLDRAAFAAIGALGFAKGPFADSPAGIVGFASTRPGEAPDMQYVYAATGFGAEPYLPPFRKPFVDRFVVRAALLRPQSRGRIALASADPGHAPRIHSQALAAPGDLATLAKGFSGMLDYIRRPELDAFRGDWAFPHPEPKAPTDIEPFIRATAINVDHPCGTCRMGAEASDETVVDPQGRVFGIDGLRVVDASVMPSITSGNINAPVMMIAARIADMILRDGQAQDVSGGCH